jgi:hypothetical protein
MDPPNASRPTIPSTIPSESTSPLHELTWFPAIVLSFAASLGYAVIGCTPFLWRIMPGWFGRILSPFFLRTENAFFTPAICAVAWGCLIGYGGQNVRRHITVLYAWMLFLVWFLIGVVRCDSLIFVSLGLIAFVFYSLPAGLLFAKVRQNVWARRFYAAYFAILFGLLAYNVLGQNGKMSMDFLSGPLVIIIPALFGFGCGYLLRKMATPKDSTNKHQTVRRFFPRQFSLMSLFALTTAAAIITWLGLQCGYNVHGWFHLILGTLLGDALAILTCRYFSGPSPPLVE